MEKIAEKVTEFLFDSIRPAQLTAVAFVVATIFLVAPFGWVSSVGIESQVNQYRFFIWLVAISSGVLLFAWGLHRAVLFATNTIFSMRNRRRLANLSVPVGGRVLLVLLEAKLPDSVRLNSTHPDVLELRKHKLIRPAPTLVVGGDHYYFDPTPNENYYLRIMERRDVEVLAEEKVVEFYREVTGESWAPDAFIRLRGD